jgi:hypothetical protein
MLMLRILTKCVALTAFVCMIFSTPSYGESTTPPSRKPATGTVHVFLLRGLMNVFSLGMDELGGKLRSRGFQNTTVHNHLMWSFLADDAVAEYKSGKVRFIVIIGHSAGAIAAIDMANKIGDAGVPVSLVVTFDPAFKTTVTSNNVRWVVNLYISEGIGAEVAKSKGHRGVVNNVNLKNITHHMTLDKSNLLQEQAIGYVQKVARAGGPPAAKIPEASAREKIGGQGAAVPPQQ